MPYPPSERSINISDTYHPYEDTLSVPLQSSLIINGEIGLRVNKFNGDCVQVTAVANRGINMRVSCGGEPTMITPDRYTGEVGSLTLHIHPKTKFVDDEEGLASDEYLQRATSLFIGEQHVVEYVGKDTEGNPQIRIESLHDFTTQQGSPAIVEEVKALRHIQDGRR